ncbi:hypothetical protein CC2G_008988 [Coprinopsis cinerea AmutBmut pab1-1]|nr:hypothetical protein CC2G_008988 [Coprinopsis cinerea AmutBmut pab1-1]
MEKGLKRKREEDYPRITYNAGPRTFDRLFKEESLEEMKNVVRKKLGYSKDVSLQLAQLRDARTVDLEDDDDFEAFCSAARTLPVIVVQVTVPNDTGSETPLSPTTRTPTPVTESPKKKRKKRKHTADEAGEASGKKRKSPGDEQTEPPAEVDAPPPRKKKKKDKAKDANGEKTLEKENAAQKNASKSPDKPEKATLVATKDSSKSTDDATTSNPRANSDVATAAQPPSITGKSKKALKEGRDSIVDTSTANAATSGGDKDAEEPPVKPKRKKERKKPSEKAKEGEGLPQKASEKTKERTKGGKPSNDTEEEQADDERDTPTLEKVTEKPSKVPASEQDAPKQKKGKKKAKEPTPPPAKPTEPSESSSDGSDDNDESSEEETPPAKSSKSKGESKRSSHPGPSTQDRNALDALVEELFRRKALEKQQQQLVDKSVEEVTKPASKVKPAQQKPVEAKDSGSSEQPEPASKRQPKTKKFKPTPAAAKKLKDPEKCHICLRSPNHVRSRCGYVRKAGTQLLRERLAQVQGEECEDPDFKTALIHEIQELIDKKEAKEPLSTKVAASSVSISVPPLSSNPTTGSTAPAAEKQTTKASDAPNKESSVDEPLANTGSKPQAGPTKPTVHTSPPGRGPPLIRVG